MPLLESEVAKDPFVLFNRWFLEASEAGALQPDAVTLATATRSGAPSARMVLFKGVEGGAFVFYSNYGSRKGRELVQNNRAAMVFFWSIKRHQVRVSGTVRRLSREASAEYFHSRPRGAQLSALTPRWIEFWENREDRLHDRLRYLRQQAGAWRIERLSP